MFILRQHATSIKIPIWRLLRNVSLLGLFSANLVNGHAQEATLQAPATPAPTVNTVQQDLTKFDIDNGRYVAIAADCMACHTAPNGKPYAGGYGIATPVGKIYTTNITPSKTAGIGNYTQEQFARAVREGIRADGTHLYPAMPYPNYALLTDADVRSLYNYFMQDVAPVDTPATHRTELNFPFNLRSGLSVWNALYLDNTRFSADQSVSASINRGRYLVNGLAHCTACHTPRNTLMAENKELALSGGSIGPWYAPNISSDPISGIGSWSDVEIQQFLKTGHVTGKGQAVGPMAEAVNNGFQYLQNEDIKAIVAYLRVTQPMHDPAVKQPAFSYGKARTIEQTFATPKPAINDTSHKSGAALFDTYCVSCHAVNGAGITSKNTSPLYNNIVTGASRPDNLIAVILNGAKRQVGTHEVTMPSFGDPTYEHALNDEEVSLIANYVLKTFGNTHINVSIADVHTARNGGKKPLIVQISQYILPLCIALLCLIVAIISGLLRYKRAKI
jgi:mono/diheme cytochrome c family protein